jgi:hypothetical protein
MSKARLTICVGVCLLVAIPVTAALAYRKLISTSAPLKQIAQADANSVPQGLRFELRPSGFIPAENEITTGKYMLLLQNRSGLADLNFTLEREDHDRVAQSDQHRRDWTTKVQLAPGTYILSELNHPEWRSVIRVTAR